MIHVLRPRLFHRRLHFEEQPLEVFRPDLVILLLQERQLAQMVDIAQRMPTGRMRTIWRPAVMHAHAGEGRQNAYGVCRFAAAFGMNRIVREVARATHMRPGQ